MNNRIPKIIATVTIIGVGVGFLVYSARASSKPSMMVNHLLAQPGELEGRTIKVNGFVQPGSIKVEQDKVNQKTVRTFRIEHEGSSLLVKFTAPPPDTFRDQSQIGAVGKLVKVNGQYEFHAESLTAKCPSKYEGRIKNKPGQKPLFED